jgi:hypothetical protein
LSPTSPPSPAPSTDRTPDHYRGASCPSCGATIGPKHLAADLDFLLGSVIKYAFRAGRKPGESALKDLLKCRDFLDDAIHREESRGGEA